MANPLHSRPVGLATANTWADPQRAASPIKEYSLMQKLTVLAVMLVSALALALPASAGAPRDRATGGGQILVSSEGGPGSTIAFTAQGNVDDAKGQIQFIDRTAGTGQNQVRAHFVVTCVSVQAAEDNGGETAAYIGGVNRDNPADTIALYVVDNGEGAMADMDIVAINPVGNDDSSEGPCGVTEPSDEERATYGLARGNAQTYDADA